MKLLIEKKIASSPLCFSQVNHIKKPQTKYIRLKISSLKNSGQEVN